jgi:hypothetical protein
MNFAGALRRFHDGQNVEKDAFGTAKSMSLIRRF